MKHTVIPVVGGVGGGAGGELCSVSPIVSSCCFRTVRSIVVFFLYRTRSYRRSIIFYRQLVNQETCCDGYELFNDTCVRK